MKKINPIFLILFSMLLVACGSAQSVEQADSAQHDAASGAAPEIVTQHQGSHDASLPPGMASLNYSRSLNYANITWSASYVQSAFLRVPANYQVLNHNGTPYNYVNYIDVKLPLSGTHSHGDLLKLRLPTHQNVFTIYYRDWANRLNKKEIKIVRPS